MPCLLFADEWKSITYSHLVDKSIITHSNEPIAQVIRSKAISPATKKGLLQPYLEPFSSLGNGLLKSNNTKFSNIIDIYSSKAEEAAWVALFREGRFQLFYSQNSIRVFVPGEFPEEAFNLHYSIIRHPINLILENKSLAIKKLEIYAFSNDYFRYELDVNVSPYIINTGDLELNSENNYFLSSRKNSLNLESLASVFQSPVIPKAFKVTKDNKLYLYAQSSDQYQTVLEEPIGLADLAVIYRAIFHYGHNAPYVSLDENEDKRYTKVNFGGYLENTRVGRVVLEADKLFKTISTGLDIENKRFITNEINQKVPSYLSEDERSFMNKSPKQRMSVRYWFYPDSVLTVSDGVFGIVKQSTFFADFDRVDKQSNYNNSSQQMIEHLNTNFGQYQSFFPSLIELDNIGRLMALVNWLRVNDVGQDLDLDELLTVKIPSSLTPAINEKIIVLSTLTYPQKSSINLEYIRKNIKHFYLSEFISEGLTINSDQDLFDFSLDYYKDLSDNDTFPDEILLLYRHHYNLTEILESQKENIEKMNIEMDHLKKIKDYIRYNELVEKQNDVVQSYNENVRRASDLINRINGLDISKAFIVSITGGIDLSPNKLSVQYSDNDSQIKLLKNMEFTSKGNVSISKDWIRSN